MIEAKAGLGKTRLLQEAREIAAEAGLNVLAARATELERDFPFALVRQLFEPRLAVAVGGRARRALRGGERGTERASGRARASDRAHDDFAVLHGLYWVTAALAERQPLLLAIDDAHWSDAASLDYLGFLLPRLEELPLLVVLTSRRDEPDAAGRPRADLDRRVGAAPDTGGAERRGGDRAARHGAGAARWSPPFATACHEVSGGNPFLLCELARTLVEQEIEPERQASGAGCGSWRRSASRARS